MSFKLFIHWSFDSKIFQDLNTPNWYGLLFVSGMICGYFVIKKMFQKEQISNDTLDQLVMYMVPATIIGARLGHVFFYGPYWGPDGYFTDPIKILYVWEGGLASHGAAIVILIALWYFSKKVIQKPFLWILDRISAPIAIAGTFIRLGNLVNHEIVGHKTTMPWGFRFLHHPYHREQIDLKTFDWSTVEVRHATNLYESMAYLLSFGILMFLFWKKEGWKKPGLVFGAFLVLIFGFRFLIEFLKEGQTDNDNFVHLWTGINTGQWLSVPLVFTGLVLIYLARKKEPLNA